MSDHDKEHLNPQRSRLEDEVLEILARTDLEPGRVIKFKSRAQRERVQRTRQLRDRIGGLRLSGREWLIASVVLAILAMIINHSSPLLAKILALGCIGCLAMIYVVAFRELKGPTTKRWRGRDIDTRPPSENPLRGWTKGSRPPKR